VLEAFDRGINFFFLSADMHWPFYEEARRGISELLRARPGARDQIVVAAVSYVAHPDFVVEPFREVIEAVPGLERIDITLAGGVGRSKEFETVRLASFAKHLDPAMDLIPGIRATGATFHHRPAAATALAAEQLDIAFVRYNADHRGAEHDLFSTAKSDRQTLLFNFNSVQGYVPQRRFGELGFEADAWRPKVADHYRFVLARAELDGILCSPRTVEQLDALADGLEQGPLSAEEISYVKSVTDLHLGRIRIRRAC
jgi:aryl-alcohol dehydrogenase-like predicted oxidoreductase